MDLHDAQTEHRRAWKRERYRKTLPLSAYKRIMAVTIWWEAGKLVCMALRYLETEYLATRTRCGIAGDGQATGVSAHGVAHPHAVPDHWRALFLESIAGLTDEQQAALDHPDGKKLQYQAKAKKFLMEVALVDYVLAKNQKGLAVSSRAVLARKGYLLDPLTVDSHTRLQKLPRKGLKWVARWQKRHGLTRGRFRQGCGLTPEQQRAKVPGINTHFSFTGTRFVHVPVCLFSSPNSRVRGSYFRPAQRFRFPLPSSRNNKGDGTKFRVARSDPLGEFGNRVFFISSMEPFAHCAEILVVPRSVCLCFFPPQGVRRFGLLVEE